MNSHGSNNKLLALAQQLRLYNYSLRRDEDLAAKQQQNYGYKVINLTHMGFQESVITSTHPRWFEPRRAAVLVCIFEGDCGEFRVLLTERSSRLSAHPGKVSLPGGKAEEGDKDDRDTATRETNEEIGLDPSLVDVIAVLPPFLCKHLPKVIPVVGILRNRKAFNAALNPAEVQVLFDAPLQMFIQNENGRVEERDWVGEKYMLPCFDYQVGDRRKYQIWGLTAAILIKVASIVYQSSLDLRLQDAKFNSSFFLSKF